MDIATEMLKHIKDPSLQQQYANIINGTIVSAVHCNSDICKGRIIAHINSDGQVTETQPLLPTSKQKKLEIFTAYGLFISGLEGNRQRLDGQWGFRCYCGNNSILASHEEGIIGASAPTKRDLEKVFGRLQDLPANYVEKDGHLEVDGFTIERIN